MCGIAGVIARGREPNTARMSSTLRMLHHRGPDHTGHLVHHDHEVYTCLGFTRLSIIDLADRANQPMVSADGKYALVFNGEIYNYRELRPRLARAGWVFRTESDTEVLLAAWSTWGSGCVTELTGMFAFAIHDRVKHTLTCVRDAFGIKPLFYSLSKEAFYFSSELPSLLHLRAAKARVNLQTTYDYLVHGDYDSSDSTFVDGVRQLRPGEFLQVSLEPEVSGVCSKWWTPKIGRTSNLTFPEAADAVREAFLENVRLHLRSDVPLGAALSGGIDSSAVVCAMRKVEPDYPIHTFSFVARGHAISEEAWLDLVNIHINAHPHKVFVTDEELVRDLDEMICAQGEPFGSTSVYAQYRVFQLAKESGVTVTLDGQGADELLAGYHGYPGYRLLSLCSEGSYGEAFRMIRRWKEWPGRSYKLPALQAGRALFPDGLYGYLRKAGGHNAVPDWLNAGMLKDAGVLFRERRESRGSEFRSRRVVEELAYSLQNRGLPALLRHEDRNAMHFSVESRVPFLTAAFCDLLFALPEHYLISNEGETKSIFRAAMRGIVPDAILDRRDKIGFATPEKHWLQRHAPVLRKWLSEAGSVPFLNVKALRDRFEATMSGRVPFNWQVWRWVNYLRWYEHFIQH